MNATINVIGKRLQDLMGSVHFRSDFDEALYSPEHLMAIGEHNLREYEKIEAMDEERQERIWNLISTILAGGLQKEVIDKYGNDDTIAVRKFLEDLFKQPENKVYWDRLIQCINQALAVINLTEEQRQTVSKLLDLLPAAIIEGLVELTRPMHLIPYAEVQQIASVLADMLKENHHVDYLRVN